MEMDSGGILDTLEELYDILYYGLGIADLGVTGIVLIYGIIAGLIAAILGIAVSLLVFILEAIPLYKISTKMGRRSAFLIWLSWLPVIGGFISTYVLADVVGNKPLKLTNKVIIQNRLLSVWIRIGIAVFGSGLITAVIGIVSFIPVLGQIIGSFSTLLYLAPTAAVAWIEYAYLRDVLDVFNENQKANRNAAIVIAILDALVTFGFARAFYLYTVMNKEPLPQTIYQQPYEASSINM